MKIKLIDYGYQHKPYRAHFNDAGADVYARDNYMVRAHETVKIPLGFGLELPDGYMGLVFPRSSWAAKGVICELPPIDSGYRGEIHAIVTNHGDEPVEIFWGDRIGQLVILPIVVADFVGEYEVAAGGERGTGAFGSTGK